MTHTEIETFIRCMGKFSDGWDVHIIVGAYQHLPIDEAIHVFVNDLLHYNECKKTEDPYLLRGRASSPRKNKTLYDRFQTSEKIN